MRSALLALVVVLLVGAGPAAAVPPPAHARLQKSTPAADTVVESAPQDVVLTFTREIAPPATVVLTSPSGDHVGAEPIVSGPEVSVPLSGQERGTYAVAYRVVSVDGHPIAGRFTFSVGHRTAAAAVSSARDGSRSWWVVGTAATAVVAIAGLVLARHRRQSRDVGPARGG